MFLFDFFDTLEVGRFEDKSPKIRPLSTPPNQIGVGKVPQRVGKARELPEKSF